VEIGTGVTKIGRSSFTLAQGLFNEGRCVASVEAVIVLFDGATRVSRPLPPTARAILERLTLRSGS
jgi:acyl-CoA thioester hydrolase